MIRTRSNAGFTANHSVKQNQHIMSVPLAMEYRWQDRAGEEIEQPDSFWPDDLQCLGMAGLALDVYGEDGYQL